MKATDCRYYIPDGNRCARCVSDIKCETDECSLFYPRLSTSYAKTKDDDIVHHILSIRTFANGSRSYMLDNGDYVSEDMLEFNQPIPESDLRISVERLREVLNEIASVRGIVNESVDEIINRVKKEI